MEKTGNFNKPFTAKRKQKLAAPLRDRTPRNENISVLHLAEKTREPLISPNNANYARTHSRRSTSLIHMSGRIPLNRRVIRIIISILSFPNEMRACRLKNRGERRWGRCVDDMITDSRSSEIACVALVILQGTEQYQVKNFSTKFDIK